MEVRRSGDPAEFSDRVSPLLMADEAGHNVMLSILVSLREQPDEYPEFGLWLVEHDGQVVGAAAITPPHNLLLALPARAGAIGALARALHDDGVPIPGVVAAVAEVDEFVSAWTTISGHGVRHRMDQGLFRLTAVTPGAEVPGRMRPAERDDRDLMLEWIEAFQAEALPGAPASDMGAWADRRIDAGALFVWADGRPVSMAGSTKASPNGSRVGPVYTPPEFRRRGYAGALTAAVSARLLERGNTFCVLYTDLTNPTSNRIYQAIGYERIGTSAEVQFD